MTRRHNEEWFEDLGARVMEAEKRVLEGARALGHPVERVRFFKKRMRTENGVGLGHIYHFYFSRGGTEYRRSTGYSYLGPAEGRAIQFIAQLYDGGGLRCAKEKGWRVRSSDLTDAGTLVANVQISNIDREAVSTMSENLGATADAVCRLTVEFAESKREEFLLFAAHTIQESERCRQKRRVATKRKNEESRALQARVLKKLASQAVKAAAGMDRDALESLRREFGLAMISPSS